MSMRQLSEQDRFYGTSTADLTAARDKAVALFESDMERKFQLEPEHVRKEHYSNVSSYVEWDRGNDHDTRAFFVSDFYREALLSWWRADLPRGMSRMIGSSIRKRLHSNSPSPSGFDSPSKSRRKLDFDRVEYDELMYEPDVHWGKIRDDYDSSDSDVSEITPVSESRLTRKRSRSRSQSFYEEASVERV